MLLQAAGMKLGRWNGIGTWDEAEEDEEEQEEFRPIRKGYVAFVCSALQHEFHIICLDVNVKCASHPRIGKLMLYLVNCACK